MLKSLNEICENCERMFLSHNCICTKKCDAYKNIAKRLKALEIIKENACNVLNTTITFKNILPQEEYELLKETLKNG